MSSSLKNEGCGDAATELKRICFTVADLNARLEDRKQKCANALLLESFEFRAVRVGFPMAVLNTAVETTLTLSSMAVATLMIDRLRQPERGCQTSR